MNTSGESAIATLRRFRRRRTGYVFGGSD